MLYFSFSMIIALIYFFIKLNKAKKSGDLLKIERIENAPKIKTKWFESILFIIIFMLLGSHNFSKYEDILVLILMLFFTYLAVRSIINLIKIK